MFFISKAILISSSDAAHRSPHCGQLQKVWVFPLLVFSRSVILWTSLPGSSVHGISLARILGWVAISFLQGIFPTQGLNPGLPHCRVKQTLYRLSHQGSPVFYAPKSLQMVTAAMKLKDTPWKESYDQPR